ncbi:glycosyl hydrolase family 3 N terminal domain-containing protein [Microdochium bolleyi]|uniref:beta-glucosidase n=1 Tax=Microdochium bolleyi TaxID=196109 RepID=A0A136ILB0_9PEZI|nr:glycosyl hydrolase family 3 N terminal domain-containing protein [Microdochium bolleyi]
MASSGPHGRGCGRPKPIYKDPSYSVDERVDDLVRRMTREEKAGQLYHHMLFPGPFNSTGGDTTRNTTWDMVVDKKMTHFNLVGNVKNATETAEFVNSLQRLAVENTRLGIPITLSTDPRHAFTENIGTGFQAGSFSQWPETLGLAALRDPALVRKFGDVVRQEYLAVGFKAALHPQVDVVTEYRWARTAGTWGEDARLTADLIAEYVKGMQLGGMTSEGDEDKTFGHQSITTVTKHFPGGGPAEDGEDSHFTYGKNNTYPGGQFEYHLIPFKAAVAAGTRQMMPAYSRPTGLENLGYPPLAFGFNKPIITGLLREQLGFEGIVLTDWGLITDAVIRGQDMPARAWGLEDATEIERAIKVFEAGCDQLGGEHRVEIVIELMDKGHVSEDRIDVSVRKVLKEKFVQGLFDSPYVDVAKANSIVGQEAFVKLGADTQRRSYTLLTNKNAVLPVRETENVKFYIEGFNQTYMEKRGLTVVKTPEEADLALLRITAPSYPRPGGFESAYASGSLEFTDKEKARQAKIYAAVPTVVDITFNRAVAIPEVFEGATAVLGDYGSGPEAFLDVVFGVSKPEGKLPFDLPRSQKAVEEAMEDVPFDTKNPVFRFGHGLSYD